VYRSEYDPGPVSESQVKWI